MKPKKILWIDLETTGLDPRKDDLLEVAVAVSSFERPFDVLHTGAWLVAHRWDRRSWPIEVYEMHKRSGLLAAIDECRNIRFVSEVEREILSLIDPVGEEFVGKPIVVLGGSCVGPFDLQFLRNVMPSLVSKLIHRAYDVSSIKLFCQSLGMPEIPKNETHRAMADVMESIDHAERCRDWLDILRRAQRHAELGAAEPAS
jgi:oligoribonuclease